MPPLRPSCDPYTHPDLRENFLLFPEFELKWPIVYIMCLMVGFYREHIEFFFA